MTNKTNKPAVAVALALGVTLAAMSSGCGMLKKHKSDKNNDTASAADAVNQDGAVTPDPHAGLPDASQAAATPPADVPFTCLRKKKPAEFMTSLVQDLFRRGPNDDELKMAADPAFDPGKAVDWALGQQDAMNGVAYFVSNLFRIEQNIRAVDPKDVDEAALVADLKQEPVVFIQRNWDKPWSDLMTTRDIFCTARTAPLYKYPVDANISGFVACQMDPERAGLLSLVSVLRAFPSSFYMVNNNYHRVALAVYLAQGLQLAANTTGPTGDGRPAPLDACVPQVDNRISPDGLVYGAAAVPKAGATCAGCHSMYHAPMWSGFLRFGPDGEVLDLTDIDKLNNTDLNGSSRDLLKDILVNGGKSCWRGNGADSPPEVYTGMPGLARIIADSPNLGHALAILVQKNLMNHAPNATATDEVVKYYDENGKSLKAAMRGYFSSDVYECAQHAE